MRVEVFYSAPHGAWAWVLLTEEGDMVESGWVASEALARARCRCYARLGEERCAMKCSFCKSSHDHRRMP